MMLFVSAWLMAVMVSSVVSTFALAPLWSLSLNVIHPCDHSPVVVHCVPLALIQTVTRLPRRIASDLARAKVAIKSLVVDVRLDDAIRP